eukprot:364247-Chlamydomonas_euryale.AAC.14
MQSCTNDVVAFGMGGVRGRLVGVRLGSTWKGRLVVVRLGSTWKEMLMGVRPGSTWKGRLVGVRLGSTHEGMGHRLAGGRLGSTHTQACCADRLSSSSIHGKRGRAEGGGLDADRASEQPCGHAKCAVWCQAAMCWYWLAGFGCSAQNLLPLALCARTEHVWRQKETVRPALAVGHPDQTIACNNSADADQSKAVTRVTA